MNFFHSLLKTVICLITAGVIFVQNCLAQDDPTSIQAHMLFSEGFINANSPDAWSMIKYGDANVNLYTGSIGLSIPVYTYQDEDFTIPISLDYATTGYKPNVQTGILGMGWYLNVGGAITREVRGVYDEERTISLGIYSFDDKWKGDELLGDSGLIPPKVYGYGALYNRTNFSYDDYYMDYAFYGKTGEEYLPIHVHLTDDMYNYAYETRPDLFHFNFMNYSGTFILQPNGNVIVYNTSHPASEFSIDVTLDEYNGFTSFVITTGDMTKYYFTEIEKAKGFRVLMEDYGLTQQQLADTLGISRSTLANTVRLLNLSPKVMELVMEGKLTEGHCRTLLSITDPDKQYKAALRIIEKGQSVNELEKSMKN